MCPGLTGVVVPQHARTRKWTRVVAVAGRRTGPVYHCLDEVFDYEEDACYSNWEPVSIACDQEDWVALASQSPFERGHVPSCTLIPSPFTSCKVLAFVEVISHIP